MPSLRNPVGPLPSSIYWRRRLVVLVVLAVVLVLILWLLLSGGGGGKHNGASGPASSTPAASITPGGSSDGSKAGGTGAGGGSGGSSGGTTPNPSGSGSASAPAGTNGGTVVVGGGTDGGTVSGGSGVSGGTAGSGGSGGGSTGGGGTAATGGGSGDSVPPANSTGTMNLPACAAADVELALTSDDHTYDSSQWPTFRLAITNNTEAACRVDLGAKSAVLTVTGSGDSRVWSSGDCPRVTTAQWYAVPAAGTLSNVAFVWNRTTSAPGCTPGGGGGAVGAGTYVATITVSGVPIKPLTQFKLAPIGS